MIREALALAITCACTGATFAQDYGGFRAELTLGIGAVLDSDPDLNGIKRSGVAGLGTAGLTMSSKTRTQALKFQLDAKRNTAAGTQIKSRLSYSRATKSSQFDASVVSARLPVGDFTTAGLEPSGSVDLAARASGVRTQQGNVRFMTGIKRPFGTKFTYTITRRKTDGMTVIRGTRQKLEFGVNARLNRRAILRGVLGGDRLRVVGATPVTHTKTRVGVGVTFRPSKLLTLEFDVGSGRFRDDAANVGGMEWRVAATRQGRVGDVFAYASSEQLAQGRLDRLQFGLTRATEHHKFKVAVGLATLAVNSREPTIDLRYSATAARSRLDIALSRDFSGSDESGETRIATKLDVGLSRRIGARGALDLSVSYLKTDATALAGKRSATHVGAAYRLRLREDWGIVLGGQRRTRRDETGHRVGSNSVHVTFERRFKGGL